VRKICVITGTRAEYGQLRWLMEGIQNSSELDLQVCVTGMHLSPEFGLTYREIETDGFPIDCKVEMLLSSDTSVGVSKSMGLGLIGFADAFHSLKPDLVLILGDRYEIFAAGAAANADTIVDLTYVEQTTLLTTDASGGGHDTSVTQGVDTLVSVAATKVGSSTAGSATNTLFGNYSTQSSTFVTTANSSISLTEASKIEFGADALSAALNTYRTSSGKDGGTYSISGTDSAKFSIDKTSGLVTNVADMDADSNTSFTFDVSYTDKAGGVFTDSVTLNLLNSTTDDGTHLGDVDLTSSSSANTSITILDTAINQIASAQAKLGAIQNRLQHNIDNLSAASMLTETAKGRIVDADFARETTELSKQQILGQAATSMLAQANQSKQSVLALLQ